MITLDIDRETARASQDFMAQVRALAEESARGLEERGVAKAAAEARALRFLFSAPGGGGAAPDERLRDTRRKAAWPFHGASDFKCRAADLLVNKRVSESFTALARGKVSFGPVAAGDGNPLAPAAKWCATKWRDMMGGGLRAKFYAEFLVALNAAHGGGRGLSGMWTGWKERLELAPRFITLPQAALLAAPFAGVLPEEFDPALFSRADLAQLLLDSGVCASRLNALECADALVSRGWCEAFCPQVTEARADLRALALGEALWIPPDAGSHDFDDTESFHTVEWLTPEAFKARAASEGWDKGFTRETLERCVSEASRGAWIFPFYGFAQGSREAANLADASDWQKRVQLITTRVTASDADGVAGRYSVVWSPACEGKSARGVRLMGAPGGGWDVQLFATEIVSPFAIDARGVPHLAAGLQSHGAIGMKTLGNIAQMQLGAITTSGRRGSGTLRYEPLGEIQVSTGGRAEFMRPPGAPESVAAMLEHLGRYRDEYFGLENKDLTGWEELRTMRLETFLPRAAETVRKMLSCQVRATRGKDPGVPPEVLEAGALPCRIVFNPRETNLEAMETVAKVFREIILPLDRNGKVNLDALIESLVPALMPEHADSLVFEGGGADAAVKDEEKRWLAIKGSIAEEFADVKGGSQNFPARLQFYQRLFQLDPGAMQPPMLTPFGQQLLQRRLEYLNFGMQQEQNAETGRTGVAGATAAGASGAVAESALAPQQP
jgi:hypothetical protein